MCQGNSTSCSSPGDYKIAVYYNVHWPIIRSRWPSGTTTDWTRERDYFRKWVRKSDIAKYDQPRIFLDSVFGKGQSL